VPRSRYIGEVAATRALLLLVGDDPLSRAGLSALISGREEVAVAGEARAAEAAALARARGVDAILWDLGPAGEGGAADGIAAAVGSAPVVALAASEAQAALALRAGARGVLLRGAEAGAVAAAAVAVARGLAVLDAGLAGSWTRPPGAAPGEGLTAREREVLALLAEGLGNKAIAARLGVSEHTAKFHVNAILGKLGAESRAEAIVRAVRLGLVAL